MAGLGFTFLVAAMALAVASMSYAGQGTNVNPAPDNIQLTGTENYVYTYIPNAGPKWTVVSNSTSQLAHSNHRAIFKLSPTAGVNSVSLLDEGISNISLRTFMTLAATGITAGNNPLNTFFLETDSTTLKLSCTAGRVLVSPKTNLEWTVPANVIGTSKTTSISSTGSSVFGSTEAGLTLTSNTSASLESTVSTVVVTAATGVTVTATTGGATFTAPAGTTMLKSGADTPATVILGVAGTVAISSDTTTVIAANGTLTASAAVGAATFSATTGAASLTSPAGTSTVSGAIVAVTAATGTATMSAAAGTATVSGSVVMVMAANEATLKSTASDVVLNSGSAKDIVAKVNSVNTFRVAAATVTSYVDLRVAATKALVVGADARTLKVGANTSYFKLTDVAGGATDGTAGATVSGTNTDFFRIDTTDYAWEVATTAMGGNLIKPMAMRRYMVGDINTTPSGGYNTGVSFRTYGCATLSNVYFSGGGNEAAQGPSMDFGVQMNHNAASGNWYVKWFLNGYGGMGTILYVDVTFVISTWCDVNTAISGSPFATIAPTTAPTAAPSPAPTAAPTPSPV